MAKRIIKETPLDNGNRPAIDLPTGGKMEFPEPAKLIEETIEFDAAETVLLNQLVKDKAAQQPQEVQQVQPSSSSKQPTGDLSAILEKNGMEERSGCGRIYFLRQSFYQRYLIKL